MEFQYPHYFLLLLLIPIWIIWYMKRGKNYEGVIQISSFTFISEKIKKSGFYKNWVISLFQILILILIVIGLSRPRSSEKLKSNSIDVVDILLVLDISSSMLADDFKPNRLEVVKRTAITFIKKRIDDRLGVIVFAGESFIQCPLTTDKDVLESLVKQINIVAKEYDGTAIGMAIANATNRLRKSNVKNKVMILLSDGSNNRGEIDPQTAAEIAASFGIKIYAIGAGTSESFTKIPGQGIIKNEIDEETLKNIAEITKGKYFRALDENTLGDIYDEIDLLERSIIEVNEYTLHRELFGWFLIPAFILGFILYIFKNFNEGF